MRFKGDTTIKPEIHAYNIYNNLLIAEIIIINILSLKNYSLFYLEIK
jgi:hypothetical protein